MTHSWLLRAALPCLLVLAAAAPAAPADERAAPLQLFVDATDSVHHIYHVREQVPVSSDGGELTLLYPQWEPASHAPTASAGALAGLQVSAAGQPIAWRRDPLDLQAFQVQVPRGVQTIDLDFQFVSPLSARQGPITMTTDIVTVPWHRVLLYPARAVDTITVAASVLLPGNMQAVSALALAPGDHGTLQVPAVPLAELIDSPVYAARALRRITLEGGDAPVRLDLLAGDAALLDVPGDAVTALRTMLAQTARVFPGRPFHHYDFIVALSDTLPGPGGIEHRSSSENIVPATFFKEWPAQLVYRDLLPHEFVHAWNGLAHRPRGHHVADYNTPVSNDLLWVYEGQTEFWARVLAARSGLRTPQQTLDALALDAASALARPGRQWRPLQDTTNDPILTAGHPPLWRDWQRREDYYGEGVLLWLAVDATLRDGTGGRAGMDDFARAFFAAHADAPPADYDLADLCAVLHQLLPIDWQDWFQQRLQATDDRYLLDGLRLAGYELVYTGQASTYFRQNEVDAGAADFSTAIGLTVTQAGMLKTVSWNGKAFTAGLNPGDRLTCVNGAPFTVQVLAQAIGDSSTHGLSLGVSGDQGSRTITLDDHGTLRYPHLVRRKDLPDRLSHLLRPL